MAPILIPADNDSSSDGVPLHRLLRSNAAAQIVTDSAERDSGYTSPSCQRFSPLRNFVSDEEKSLPVIGARKTQATSSTTTASYVARSLLEDDDNKNAVEFFALPMSRRELKMRRERFLVCTRIVLRLLDHRKDHTESQRLRELLWTCTRQHHTHDPSNRSDNEQQLLHEDRIVADHDNNDNADEDLHQQQQLSPYNDASLGNHLIPSLHRTLLGNVRDEDWKQAQKLTEIFYHRRRQNRHRRRMMMFLRCGRRQEQEEQQQEHARPNHRHVLLAEQEASPIWIEEDGSF